MAATHTLTGNFHDLLGDAFDASQIRAYVEPSQTFIVDTDPGGGGRFGRKQVTINADGSWTIDGLPDTEDPGWNPTGFGLRLVIEVRDGAQGASTRTKQTTTNWFALTADTDFKDVAEIELEAVSTELRDTIHQWSLDAQEAAAAAEAVGITNDTIIAGRINTPGSATATALLASDGPISTRVLTDVETDGSALREELSKHYLPSVLVPPAPNQRRRWPALAMISDVQTGHGWTKTGNGTADLNYTGDYILGTQCLELTTSGAATNCVLQKTAMTPINLTNKGLLVWVKITGGATTANVSWVNVGIASDNSFANLLRASLVTNSPGLSQKEQIKVDEWFPMFINRGNFTVVAGTPDISAITAIRIDAADATGTSAFKVRIGGVAYYDDAASIFANGVVSLTFDDSYPEAWTVAAPYMAKFGYPGTLYPIIGNLDAAGFLTTDQLRKMQDSLGWEIGAHASDVAHHVDYTAQTDDWIVAESRRIREWQGANGFNSSAFAYPIGPYSAANSAIVSRFYASARSTHPWVHGTKGLNPQRLMSLVTSPTTSLATAKAFVGKVKAGKGWGIFTIHDLVASGGTVNRWAPADFRALVDYIAAQGVAVATVGDVLNVAQMNG